jgi:quinol monooxygenase YgiN
VNAQFLDISVVVRKYFFTNIIKSFRERLAKNGLTSQLENILLNLIPPTRKEEGNIAYVLYHSIDNPNA